MKKKLYIITGKDNFLGQFRKPWFSLDVKIFEQELKQAGWATEICEYHQVANGKIRIENSYVFYTFSQKDEYRIYLKDVIYFLKMQGNILIPPYELLLCHEDKGFQELLKKKLQINDLNFLYLADESEIDSYRISYPVVLKTLNGSNGRGVFLIKNENELHNQLRSLQSEFTFSQRVDLVRRKHFRLKKKLKGWQEFEPLDDYFRYKEYIRKSTNYVLQEFIPSLEHDFRVLYIAGHYYITKRHVKKNDFRASGSKLFDFDTGDIDAILNHAEIITRKFELPYLSLDLVREKDAIHLLEFQANHFGTNVIKLSQGYYRHLEGEWHFTVQKPDVNQVLASGLCRYLEKIYDDGKRSET
jgi:glutathione synthase/RimK-type ligase-like ATP-grasp enzyme